MKIIRLISTLAALSGVVHGQSIVDVAKGAEPEFTTLVAALEAADLADALDCTGSRLRCGKFTVFAPTNAAFANVPTPFFEALLTPEFKQHLQLILYYHLVHGEIKSTDIEDGGSVRTVLGSDVTTSLNPVRINEATVDTTLLDIEADNGVIHAIDSVLVPSFLTKTLLDVVSEEGGHFSILAAAATTAGLDLSGFDGTTVFAPTDDAFMKLGQARINALLDNPETLLSILQYHVIDDAIVFQNELEASTITTRQGSSITVEESSGWWFSFLHHRRFTLNTDVNIVSFNTVAQNGIIHAIDSVLLPPGIDVPNPNIVEIVSAEPTLTTLLAAVGQAELAGLLQGDGPFTVFAPSDSAFDKLPDGTLDDLLLEENKQDLIDLLSYHVVSGAAVLSTDLTDGRVDTFLEVESGIPQRIDVTLQGSKIQLNGNTKVTTPDIVATNGVIHIIDEVLIPPKNIASIASDDMATFSSLVAAASTAGLVNALGDETTELTVFAPTNDAFDKFLDSQGLTLEALSDETNQELLNTIVSYHVVSGYVPLRDLTEGDVPTLGGEVLEVDLRFATFLWWHFLVGVKLDGSTNIDTFDIFASNGVVHVIDEVLVPPSIRG